jgi:hypothetical protein
MIFMSFIWAFVPFLFAVTIAPALCEMSQALSICRIELLFADGKQRGGVDHSPDKQPASAEIVVKRSLSHVSAAAVNAGRSAQLFGLAIPVRTESLI